MTILAEGQIAITPTAIFTVDRLDVYEADRVTVEKITFFNTNELEQTAILYVQPRNESAVSVRQFVLQESEGGEYLEPGEVLELRNGDELQAETTTASVVNYVVLGERK